MNYKPNTKRIKLEMLKKGYSISRLSKESNIAKSTIARLLKEEGNQRPSTIYKIAEALEIDIETIIIEEN